jgi:phospho-N-acetylmuramoyl-pentapeptide-transferase
MAPFHHHLELLGWNEPIIIAAAYAVAYILAMVAAHIGLISA